MTEEYNLSNTAVTDMERGLFVAISDLGRKVYVSLVEGKPVLSIYSKADEFWKNIERGEAINIINKGFFDGYTLLIPKRLVLERLLQHVD